MNAFKLDPSAFVMINARFRLPRSMGKRWTVIVV